VIGVNIDEMWMIIGLYRNFKHNVLHRESKKKKSPLERPRLRWANNIKMNLGEIGWSDVDWIGLAQDRDKW
jgi:hypothetical protein